MKPSILGMLRASVTLVEAAESGDTCVGPEHVKDALTYIGILINQHPDDTDLMRVASTSPVLLRLLFQSIPRPAGEPLH